MNYEHAHFCLPLRCLHWATTRSVDWHPLVSTSVTLPAACEVGTEQQSEALGNICGQLHGEEGAKERNLLLINKIMGAIRPFSHHRCLQSLSHPLPFCLSLCALPTLSHFFYKKWHSLFKNGVKNWESVRERKQGWGGGRGGAWSSNQQLTGVRMFMGRVSLSDQSSVSSAVALNSHSL